MTTYYEILTKQKYVFYSKFFQFLWVDCRSDYQSQNRISQGQNMNEYWNFSSIPRTFQKKVSCQINEPIMSRAGVQPGFC